MKLNREKIQRMFKGGTTLKGGSGSGSGGSGNGGSGNGGSGAFLFAAMNILRFLYKYNWVCFVDSCIKRKERMYKK